MCADHVRTGCVVTLCTVDVCRVDEINGNGDIIYLKFAFLTS